MPHDTRLRYNLMDEIRMLQQQAISLLDENNRLHKQVTELQEHSTALREEVRILKIKLGEN